MERSGRCKKLGSHIFWSLGGYEFLRNSRKMRDAYAALQVACEANLVIFIFRFSSGEGGDARQARPPPPHSRISSPLLHRSNVTRLDGRIALRSTPEVTQVLRRQTKCRSRLLGELLCAAFCADRGRRCSSLEGFLCPTPLYIITEKLRKRILRDEIRFSIHGGVT